MHCYCKVLPFLFGYINYTFDYTNKQIYNTSSTLNYDISHEFLNEYTILTTMH